MTSNINANNIDGQYPVAGQDNDSQGFRTNFTNIKNNFTNAAAEITDLQSKVILKSALTGESLNNNMAGTVLQGAEVKDIRESRVAHDSASGAVDIDFSRAHNHVIVTSGAIELSFTGFPAVNKVGRVRVEIDVTSTGHTLYLGSTVDKGVDSIAGYDSVTDTITFSEIGVYHFEFWTDNNGTSIHVEDKTRTGITKHVVERTPANTGQAGDVAGMVAVDADYMYICTATYDGSTVIWKRAPFSAY